MDYPTEELSPAGRKVASLVRYGLTVFGSVMLIRGKPQVALPPEAADVAAQAVGGMTDTVIGVGVLVIAPIWSWLHVNKTMAIKK